MPAKWNDKERKKHYLSLYKLYVINNKTISEIGVLLNVSDKTIFKRLKILGIPTNKKIKSGYANQRNDIKIVLKHSVNTAECFGILLGDGHISKYQTIVTLGSTEKLYATYVSNLFEKVFSTRPKTSIRANGHLDIYLNSVPLVQWLKSEGLVSNKTKKQVDVPMWLFENPLYMKAFLRGFFDTDGSIYKLRFGIQLSFTNRSLPLLLALQKMLNEIQYKPSEVSSWKIYITQKKDIQRFFREIKPKNHKHLERFKKFQ
jgi:DNA-binding transcriptional regulator WhiA